MRKIALALVVLWSVAAVAALPPMSRTNENKLLKAFPLEVATKADVMAAYGPPDASVTGLPNNGESWTYGSAAGANCSGFGCSKVFVFLFQGDTVYDVQVRYPGSLFKPRSARKVQGK